MDKKYLIQSLTDNGYWSLTYKEFKGLLFARRYRSESEAWHWAEKVAEKTEHTVTVVPIFELD